MFFVDLENETNRLALLQQRNESDNFEELDDSENLPLSGLFSEQEISTQSQHKEPMLLEDTESSAKEEKSFLKGKEGSDRRSNESRERKGLILNKKISKRSKTQKNPFENRAGISKRSKSRKNRWFDDKVLKEKDYLSFSPGNNFFLAGEPAKRSYIKKHAFMNYSELLSQIPKLSKFNWFETKLSSCNKNS